jgi:DNA-binding MarR family transcriptional regulator
MGEDKARKLVDHLQTVMEEAQAADKKAASENLSAQEMRVLRCVGREDCPIMSAIARAVCLSVSSVTGLVDRLVAKRLVRRARRTGDRRAIELVLTEEGKQARESAVETQLGLARGILKGLEPKEQEELIALFGKASRRIKEEKAKV